ncbi:MAG TPA: long-chain fatty acid--CoA ligase [Gammaproteobacteria bacterium]|uniref:long-chain-fatty-acid--CoA ligase n=1 Tax=unclassified Ketobacter TaxID=2639109 RepID=UPI000E832F0B|nr:MULTISPECIES: long-chain-fatty-acid--CoA ligase [unclassified Ketobacter]HAG93087.1 long-chain fatty acid--CoA ligase [Gammaproteobacteria bacterium]RLT87885.1 MAG: long-chain-fatty-acid--CoA ligase [Ketobacter sp. GenoA1]RLT96451.1 MAG: long-chain-fatty-acid--CoA ligase [Ketobacter sp.]HAU14556.1 long-chain fatty acid--CoA ligase [Gammaproteobacteria bacterium]HBO95180.1 long-chain fatty acid--CoA ligase [Gammaproteobacteria bacterium]|tara:strand:- start:6745 stop:8361 length:1617 start_codon:yes stop_codon:yes gene_type:complete
MHGLMMDTQLSISSILRHAEKVHKHCEIVSRKPEGGIFRYTYADAGRRARQAANVLAQLGVQQQDRVATLAWNTHRHYELYFAVSGSGAILHTVNPRLFPEQIVYILNHAEDEVLFLDLQFVPLIEAIRDQLPHLKHIVLMVDKASMPDSKLDLLCYEALLEAASAEYEWPSFDENLAATLCYTSGTTGNPKGVLYSHRSTVIHALASVSNDALGVCNRSSVLPVVPMFHVNAWGVPYAATAGGARLVLPGAGMDGASLYELIDSENVSLLLGVPTVWLGLLQYCDQENRKLASVEEVVIGGSAAPMSMIRAFQEKHDAFVIHAWGMTELSPMGTLNSMNTYMAGLSQEERYKLQTKQGRPIYGIEIRIVDDAGQELPHDGKAFGRLQVRGPWVASSYYKHDDQSDWQDGWFDTGDVATLDAQGYMNIVDRAKDVIKSGGEWISSIDVENIAIGHDAVAECAVVGVPHPKWDERPLLLVVLNPGASLTKEAMLEYLADKIVKWWMPDEVLFVEELPHTPTGKLLKRQLRDQYQSVYTQ